MWQGERMRFGECTYREVAAFASTGAVAVVPLGCPEQQGPPLPVDFDSWSAEALVAAAAGQAEEEHGLRVLVLPVLPLGPTPEHRSFGAGYLDLPVALHEAVTRTVLDSLCAQAFKVTIIWRGCGGHDLSELVGRDNDEEHRMRGHLSPHPFQARWSPVGGVLGPAGHAATFPTPTSLAPR